MSKEICISSTPRETRLAILEDEQLTEVYYERENEYTLAGSIYKGRVTRVLPGMQSAFVDVGLERDAFLYVTDFLEEQEDSAEFERLTGTGGQEERDRADREPRQQPGRERKEPRATQGSNASPVDAETSAPAPNEGFQEGTRRWRGRRGRRGFRPQAAQEASQNTPRVESSQALETANPETVNQAPNQAPPIASSESAEVPFYLPGESLSKYGGQVAPKAADPAGESREPQPSRQWSGVSASKPSTLVETPIAWSGAGLLPGESRSRFSQAGSGSSESPKTPGNGQVPDEAAAPDQTAQSPMHPVAEGEARLRIPLGSGAEFAPVEVTESHPAELPAATVPEESSAAPEKMALVEEVLEFEPEDASASYRVEAARRSELRVAAAPPGEEIAEQAGQADPFPEIPEIERHFRERHASAGEQPGLEEEQDAENDGLDDDDFIDLTQRHEASAGLLEEEEINEEEEDDFMALYHHAEDHDFEEMEEETIDQNSVSGAQIDDLVRDTHIEQRVGGQVSGVTVEDAGEEDLNGTGGEPEAEEGQTAPIVPQPAHRERQDQHRGGRSHRHDGHRRHNGRRQNAQTSNLPVISELLKQGQEILVQIAKEPIAKKGARITSHIALPGRFLVFMPTVNHIGVSRKISSDDERQRLKRILMSEKGNGGGGFIVRTAADGASEEELRADIRFLISLWTEIKQREEEAKAPALIYHDLNLVERILRDQVSDDFSTIWVDSETEYERIIRFLNRFQPSLVRRVKLYTKETPLFEQFGVQEEIGKALKSKVWLKSGGSIVINQTEALVAIDINTGKYVGKTARLEDTILKTNLDAIPEIARQIRLRDLGGIIVIDFIDMDERKNRHKVMQALEDALKADRAPSKVLQFNDFGLVAITRKRVKQSLERTLCVPCAVCAGTGMTKSPTTVCNEIYVEMRKMQHHLERGDVLLRVHPEVVKALKSNNGRWLNELEEMSSKTIIVKSDPALPPEQFDIH